MTGRLNGLPEFPCILALGGDDRRRSHEAGYPKYKIGIAWQANAQFPSGQRRSIPLAAFEPLTRIPGIQLISLQKGPGTEQIPQVPFARSIVDLSSCLDEEAGPFMDTAAIMTQLDLVISCDTAIAPGWCVGSSGLGSVARRARLALAARP